MTAQLHPPVVARARTRCPDCGGLAPVTSGGLARAHNRTPGGAQCSGGRQPINNLTEVTAE